jgi:hypothetical protein
MDLVSGAVEVDGVLLIVHAFGQDWSHGLRQGWQLIDWRIWVNVLPYALDSCCVLDKSVPHIPGQGPCEQDGAPVNGLLSEVRHKDDLEATGSDN